ncbi:MAG: FkbM family methyltransferase [Terracidiphilus sp.]|jgi:FkbM family methyltransferase
MKIERISNFLRYCATACRLIGVAPTCKWIFATAQLYFHLSVPRSLTVLPSFLRYPVKLRARTSDPYVFRQIMIENEYLPLRNLRIKTILDLGANIGLASAWFLSCFPQASVLAVEAAADNAAACRDNLAPYGTRARVVHGAAWSCRTALTLHPQVCAADNIVQQSRVGDSAGMQVEGWDLPSLIELSGFAQIDLLKMDIEGAEAEVFRSGAPQWLGRVRNLCIELHGQACREAFYKALEGLDYSVSQSGELDICTNLRPKAVV